jgi:O-methyltransferase involved in polyketide biosynthesis
VVVIHLTFKILICHAGFRAAVPTVWLLEGFTGYLTEEELQACFTKTTFSSAPGSMLIATFIGNEFQHNYFNLHKFRTNDPLR